jgi:hypothetical protein
LCTLHERARQRPYAHINTMHWLLRANRAQSWSGLRGFRVHRVTRRFVCSFVSFVFHSFDGPTNAPNDLSPNGWPAEIITIMPPPRTPCAIANYYYCCCVLLPSCVARVRRVLNRFKSIRMSRGAAIPRRMVIVERTGVHGETENYYCLTCGRVWARPVNTTHRYGQRKTWRTLLHALVILKHLQLDALTPTPGLMINVSDVVLTQVYAYTPESL